MRTNVIWLETDLEILKEKYFHMGSKVGDLLSQPHKPEEIRRMARKLGLKTNRRPWDKREDSIVCKCYFKNMPSKRVNKILLRVGFIPRTDNFIRAKISNFKYLDTGNGRYGYSKQAREVYIEISGNIYPYEKPKRKVVR